MRKLFIQVLFIIVCSTFYNESFPQWVQQNSGTNTRLKSVFFVNNNTGVVTGSNDIDSSIILRTSNGGNIWYTIQIINNNGIGKVIFPSLNTGYIPGLNGFYKTTNSGINFTFISNPTISGHRCFFISNDTGFMIGTNVYKTYDGGLNWTQISVLPVGGLNCVQFINANTGFTGHNDYPYNSVCRTTNAGINWNIVYSPINTINTIRCISFPSPEVGYIFGNDGFFKTSNGGSNWICSYVNGGFGVFFVSNNIGYNGGYGIVNKTIDGGISFQNQITLSTSIIITDIHFPTNNVGYAVGWEGCILKTGLVAKLYDKYFYNDGRTQVNTITYYDSSCYSQNGTIDTLLWYVNGVRVNPSGQQPQHTMTYNYRQGTTFVQLKIKNSSGMTDSTTAKVIRAVYLTKTNGPIKAGLSLIGDDFLYAISTGNAVYRMTINGDTLYRLNTAGNILSSCSISYDTCVYICSDNTNLYGFTKFGTPIWTLPIYLGAPASCTPTIDSISNRLYLGVDNKKFYAINRQIGNIAWFYDSIDAPLRNSVVISSGRKLVFASLTGNIYGFDLNNLPSPPYPKWKLSLNDSVFTSPAIDAQGYFYFGTRSGKLIKVNLPSASTNGSIVWQANLSSPVVSSPTIDGNGNIYCGTSNGNLSCVNPSGGVKWNFPTSAAIRSTASITRSMVLYFGNDAGDFYGIDTNMNVRFYYKDSTVINCPMLYKNGTVYLGTETGRLLAFYDTTSAFDKIGGGTPIWGTFQNNVQRTGSQSSTLVSIQNNSNGIPDKFELLQNYPNPFNSCSKLKYQIAKSSNVKLKIYDVLGKEVMVLVNEKQLPGFYEVDFNGEGLATGVYFYKLETKDYTSTKKMLLIK